MPDAHNVRPITLDYFDAVIFDLDGVLTRTATLHGRAWQRMFDEFLEHRRANGRPTGTAFDYPADYFTYLDGKPRYDGVRSFLQSRNITLPDGEPSDPPDAETVCGLGNRKNALFQAGLERGDVEVFDDAVTRLRQWRDAGLKTAVVSSSKNCRVILDAVGLTDLFDARVDGERAAKLGLPGKPAPDTFLRAADELGVRPDRSVLIEDALVGVQAGRSGGFGLVIGLDRDGHNPELADHGADVVVRSLADIPAAELRASWSRIATKSPDPANAFPHPEGAPVGNRCRKDLGTHSGSTSAASCQDEIVRRMDGRRVMVFLDYDGTLTPIVSRPELATLSDEMRGALREMADVCTVAVVSGRDRRDVQKLVGLPELIYAGSHGFDITGPDGMRMEHEEGVAALPDLDAAERAFSAALADVPGSLVERKRFSVAVHYRNVAESGWDRVEQIVARVHAEHARLRRRGGKRVHELQPDVPWHKGEAVLWLTNALRSDDEEVLPVYVGDDLTDEDAFEAIAETGVGVLVGPVDRPTAARFVLRDVNEVRPLLRGIAEAVRANRRCHEWKVVYNEWDPKEQPLREALCTLGNGVWATRGAVEESSAGGPHYPGTYLAGGYNRLGTEIAGRVVENEDLVNWPNWLCLSFRPAGGTWLDLDAVEVQAFRRELDLRRGVLERRLRVRDGEGRETSLVSRRFVHMARPNLAGIEWTLTPENWSGPLEIRSALDGTVLNAGVRRYRDLNSRHLEQLGSGRVGEDGVYLAVRTNQSHICMCQAARTAVFTDGGHAAVERRVEQEDGRISQLITFECRRQHSMRVEKVVVVQSSRDPAISEPVHAACARLERAPTFAELLASHELAWAHLWQRSDIQVQADPESQLVLRLHIFHLLQTVSPNTVDRDVGIPARGLHGEAYRGHIFWDEIFILPFLNLRLPELARELLMYRHRRLPEARALAAAEGRRGAMFPWQSGSDGREESQVVHLNPRSGRWLPDETHLQRHVGLAVAFNVRQYFLATGDLEFLARYGAELVLEVARFWGDLATYNAERGRYEIHGVVGPDEYHTRYPNADRPGLRNNAYSNVMAAWVLRAAGRVLGLLGERPRRELTERLDVTDDDLARWDDISRRMFVPYHSDPATGAEIISQFEGYDALEEFDWDGYRRKYGDIQRLDRILEAEGDTPNRYKVAKQADVLMLLYLFPEWELRELFERLGYEFDASHARANVDYYRTRTSHGSTLSRIIHSWVLASTDRQRSWHLFEQALASDFKDIQGGTTPEGVHLGAMAGTVDLVQRCYAGLTIRDDVLWIDPMLPDHLTRVRIRACFRGHWLSLEIRPSRVIVTAERGWTDGVKVGYGEQVHFLREGDRKTFE